MQNVEKKFLEKIKLPDVPKEFEEAFGTMQEMFTLYSCAIRAVSAKLENLNQELEVTRDRNSIQYIDYRIKNPRSILEKMRRNHLELKPEILWDKISDIAGVRVICSYIDDIYAVAEMLIKQDDIRLLRKKDYIQNPKETG